MSGKYLRFPLALLRVSESEKDFFEEAACFSAVNAGIAAHRKCTKAEWKEKAKRLKGRTFSAEARIGAEICGVNLGETTGETAKYRHDQIVGNCSGSPVVSIPSETFWAACYTIRFDLGEGGPPSRSINWREFRLLVALSSLLPNSKGFSVAGWESISHRASGFHRKEDFKAFEDSPEPWPDHCIPLTRYQTTSTLDKLETLRFFIRHRISRGDRGGLSAYSFRHADRGALSKDCEEWQSFNRGEQVRETRSEDQLLHAKQVAKREERIRKNRSQAASILETCKSPEISHHANPLPVLVKEEKPPLEPLKHSKHASDLQVTCKSPASPPASGLQATLQHNEKCSSEKSLDEKSPHKSLSDGERASRFALAAQVEEEVTGGDEEEAQDIIEEGYLFEGRFVTIADAQAVMIQNPESYRLFKRARRVTRPDGWSEIEEIIK